MREILDWIVGDVRLQHRRYALCRRRRQQQRVAVGRRLGDEVGADDAAGTRPVFDHERLLQRFLELRRHQPGHQVGDAAGGKRGDDFDRLAGPGLRAGRGRQCSGEADCGGAGQELAACGDGHRALPPG